jgi:non-canonical poly(A) RNA polymerase PAPD5/7
MDISDDESGTAEQPNKKARTVRKAADGDSVPKWSNPDPYTALPPPDESQRKKKDVVKLIRKARVETNAGSTAKVDPADDFISFDFGDEEDVFKKNDHYDPDKFGIGVEGAPTGPRFSHAANLHKQQAPAAVIAARPPPMPAMADQQVQAQVSSEALQARTNSQNVQSRVNNQNVPIPITIQSVQARANNRNVQVHMNNENIRFAIPFHKVGPSLANFNSPSKAVKLDTTSDPALGNRKRNIQDQIKAAPVLHQVGKGVSKKPATGVVLKEWQAKANSKNTPWVEIDHSDTSNMGLW